MRYLLVIEVGNTNSKIGLYQDKRLLSRWQVATHPIRASDEIGLLLSELLSSSEMELE